MRACRINCRTSANSERPEDFAGLAVADWRRDYEQMQEVFFFGKVPAFDELMGCVQQFQEEWNGRR